MILDILIPTIKDNMSFNNFRKAFICFIKPLSIHSFSKGRIEWIVATPDFKMYLSLIITEFLLKKFKNFYEELYEMHDVYIGILCCYYYQLKLITKEYKGLDFIH